MNDDPTNKLPIDPDWLRKIEIHGEAAAKDLGCTVLMISIQENGKLCMSIAGAPETGDLADAIKDMPNFLFSLANIVAVQEEHAKRGTKQ